MFAFVLWTVAIATLIYLVYAKFSPKIKVVQPVLQQSINQNVESNVSKKQQSGNVIKVLYGTQTGTTKQWAEKLFE